MKSDFERDTRADLKKRGVKAFYEPLKVPYTLELNYIPDFIIGCDKKPTCLEDLPKGAIILELKGYLDADDRRKLLAVKAQHPNLDLRLVFMNNSFVYKNRKDKRRDKDSTDIRYKEWAEKHGFMVAIGLVPEAWIT